MSNTTIKSYTDQQVADNVAEASSSCLPEMSLRTPESLVCGTSPRFSPSDSLSSGKEESSTANASVEPKALLKAIMENVDSDTDTSTIVLTRLKKGALDKIDLKSVNNPYANTRLIVTPLAAAIGYLDDLEERSHPARLDVTGTLYNGTFFTVSDRCEHCVELNRKDCWLEQSPAGHFNYGQGCLWCHGITHPCSLAGLRRLEVASALLSPRNPKNCSTFKKGHGSAKASDVMTAKKRQHEDDTDDDVPLIKRCRVRSSATSSNLLKPNERLRNPSPTSLNVAPHHALPIPDKAPEWFLSLAGRLMLNQGQIMKTQEDIMRRLDKLGTEQNEKMVEALQPMNERITSLELDMATLGVTKEMTATKAPLAKEES